ncbi:MAG TPA: DUF6595 domain-containing protein [Ktedonobacteraceae bacterium]|jgi:hypothetical protein|nr:DUF6595 domain-containing protein [Ktedonobacteraceae bacterium]
MQLKTALLALIPTVSAHFRLYYPLWRGDALASTNNASISEWFYPCKSNILSVSSHAKTFQGAGFTQEFSANNRTQWPMTGGAVVWNSSHPDALTYINLGLGDSVTSFNVSLQGVYNETGAGVTCLPNPGAAAIAGLNLTEGQNASIQVITISGSGASLYNVSLERFPRPKQSATRLIRELLISAPTSHSPRMRPLLAPTCAKTLLACLARISPASTAATVALRVAAIATQSPAVQQVASSRLEFSSQPLVSQLSCKCLLNMQ